MEMRQESNKPSKSQISLEAIDEKEIMDDITEYVKDIFDRKTGAFGFKKKDKVVVIESGFCTRDYKSMEVRIELK